ncbi:MAG TPA: peptide deformylase, partial [Agitococcus sp.]|nr:peptide deformylase [Agitococcus sp.]
MAKLPILHFPDPRLRTKAKPVAVVDDAIRQLIKDMFETMYDAPGIGLAATQVNHHIRLVVMDLSEEKNQPMVFINPKVTPLTQEKAPYEEGCLSVPSVYDVVDRPTMVRIEALNEQGEAFSLETDGLLAVCIQHELDHLEGKL